MIQSSADIPDDLVRSLAEMLAASRNTVAFCGAGMSAESGIPTFRDPGGMWDLFPPGEFGTPGGLMQTFTSHPEKVHAFLSAVLGTLRNAHPNPGHVALAELERMGIVRSVITQNVDGLHQEAGSRKVLEVHGSLYRFKCIQCGGTRVFNRPEVLLRFAPLTQPGILLTLDKFLAAVPVCPSCRGLMRPDVVLFGEAVMAMPASYIEAANSDLMLILGTSGLVYPAANIPIEAYRTGSKVIEINPGESAFEEVTMAHARFPTGALLPRVVAEVRCLRGQ